MDAVSLINARSGSAPAEAEDVVARARAALRAHAIAGPVEPVGGDRLLERARQAVAMGARLCIIGGGDGSVGAAAGAIAGTDARLGILPLGTRNHFARDLGLPLDLDDAAAVIAAGQSRRVDVAWLCDRLFVNNSAIGLYPLFVADREGQQRLGRSKRLAMAVAGLRTLARFDHHRLALTIDDGRSATVETPLLFVGNNDYRFDLGGAGRRESISDGRLCVIALRRMGRATFFAALVRSLAGRSRPGDLIRFDHVKRLRVAARRPVLAVSSDGETHRARPPLDYHIDPGALDVIVPASRDA